MSGTKVALKITGIIVGIIVICILLGFFVGAPIFKGMKYNNAQKFAQNGQYVEAVAELQGNMDNYKDAKVKKQEYAIEAAKQAIEKGDKENALSYLGYAISVNADKTLTDEATKLFENTSK